MNEVADLFIAASRKRIEEKKIEIKVLVIMKHSCSGSGFNFIKQMFIKHLL